MKGFDAIPGYLLVWSEGLNRSQKESIKLKAQTKKRCLIQAALENKTEYKNA